jgi:hypothetical protein
VPWPAERTKNSEGSIKYRIAVVTLNAKDAQRVRGQSAKRPNWMHVFSAHNKIEYCKRWGYDLIIEDNSMVDKSRDVAWSKIPIFKKWLPHYDYLLWVDMDAFFMRHDIPIEGLIRDEKEVIIAKDWHGVNFGVFLFKNAQFSFDLMELMWNAPRHWWEPWQEQSALMKLLDKRYVGRARAEEQEKHFAFIPQRDMNSYPQHFAYGNADALYHDGDYIAHFPNCKAFPMCKAMMERFYTASCRFNGIEPNPNADVPSFLRPAMDPAKNAVWAANNNNAGGNDNAEEDTDAPPPTHAPKKKAKKKASTPKATPAPPEYVNDEDVANGVRPEPPIRGADPDDRDPYAPTAPPKTKKKTSAPKKRTPAPDGNGEGGGGDGEAMGEPTTHVKVHPKPTSRKPHALTKAPPTGKPVLDIDEAEE